MKRTAAAAVLAALALASPASAKGPHASVSSGPEGLRPGQPWVTTISFVEFDAVEVDAAQPVVVLRSRSGRFSVRPRLIGAHAPPHGTGLGEARYRLRVVFPQAGRWTYTVFDGTHANRRFRFPAATIGRGAQRVPTGYVAFAEGSRAERQGGGGPIVSDVPENPPGGDALPPEVVLPPREKDDGGLALWIPAAGLALVGAGAATVLRRRR